MVNKDITPQEYANETMLFTLKTISKARAVTLKLQPFFGVDNSKPKMIKFVAPVSAKAINNSIEDALAYGMCLAMVSPRRMWEIEPPIYTMEDICWRKL